MDQNSVPIMEALQNHAALSPDSFHVPGHKNGRAMPEPGKNMFASLLPFDQTELTGLDDLHDPHGIIASAQALAAELYGAAYTQFLIGGSTAGNLIMMLAAFEAGDVVLVQRDAHKSLVNGLRMAGVQPVFIDPAFDEHSQLSMGLSYLQVKTAFQTYPTARGLVLTSPSYYGWTPSLRPLIQEAKENGAVVAVDEAHGAHFPASAVFPETAVAQGADLVVQSAHKTLPALTMTGYLHVGPSSQISVRAVREASSMLQSSSPSYPLMASLDAARKYLHDRMQKEDSFIEKPIQEVKNNIRQASDLEEVHPPYHIKADPLKYIMKTPEGYSGWRLQKYLEKEYIYTELADHRHVVFFLSFDSCHTQSYERIERAVQQMYKEKPESPPSSCLLPVPSFGMQLMEKDWYKRGDREPAVCLVQAGRGERTAADIIPYPPGIPLFFKGERLEGERYEFLCEWLAGGGRIQGGWQEINGQWYISISKRDGTNE
ncbi:aminotransferase class I/II-fold pyridoxal phosphate-dependent enzyme [Salibacterium aidingense]|uniref:aminotransferase class I/II-fold pyridoxal phosphate-dependent enzyme n=1 Tax=Salibacterium aidingense TaxID=384933 RepID=UPI003BEB6ADC